MRFPSNEIFWGGKGRGVGKKEDHSRLSNRGGRKGGEKEKKGERGGQWPRTWFRSCVPKGDGKKGNEEGGGFQPPARKEGGEKEEETGWTAKFLYPLQRMGGKGKGGKEKIRWLAAYV